ncbi:MAG: hydrocarbon degradation protein, partial [Bacteroidales bacterium]|nr:hydrocarbon degradation protein [Bacteroidales bacterium]
MKRLLITGVVLMSSSLFLLAQNDGDAIRFSQYFPMGTARSVAMGSAFGALGADFSALSINPAGIGVYRKSELTFTPDIYYDKTQSTFYSQKYNDFKYKFLFNNLGGVFAFNSNRDKGWVGAAIGVGYNRLADYNRNVTISASNTQSSLLDEFVFYADGLDTSRLNPNYEMLAWKTDL